MADKAPLRARIVLRDKTDWDALTEADVIAAREKARRLLASRSVKILTGFPDRGARIEEHTIDLPGRRLTLRVHRPKRADRNLPLVVSFHGGGFITGFAAQNDWLNSHIAAHGQAVVVAVDYRLAPEHPVPAPIEDGYDVLSRLRDDPGPWGIDPDAVAVLGESAGGTIAALLTLHARDEGRPLQAQVLVNPALDWTETMTDYPSAAANANNPGLSLGELQNARRLAMPPHLDARDFSPLKSASLADLPPTLAVVGTLDVTLDHARRYIERLRTEGADARVNSYQRATHKFLSLPGLIPAARPARQEILTFLQTHLCAPARTSR